MKTKKQLAYFLGKVEVCNIKKQTFFVDNTKAFVINGKRLVEAPAKSLKKMQKNILRDLRKLVIPNNIFSGIKRRSYVQNIVLHQGKNYFMKIDLSKFFPHVTRDKVYKFYINKLQTSPDVARILTDLSTIDIDRLKDDNYTEKQKYNLNEAKQFIVNKNIKTRNHLMTGSRISPILSYLVNEDMFNEIQEFCDKNNIIFSLYVDDMAFSSNKKITNYHKNKICEIIKKNGYKVNTVKTKIVDINSWKRITGGIIEKSGKIKIPKELELKIKQYNLEFKQGRYENLEKLYGCLIAATLLENKYTYLYKIVYTKYKERLNFGLLGRQRREVCKKQEKQSNGR